MNDFIIIHGTRDVCEYCDKKAVVYEYDDMTMCADCLSDHFDLETEEEGTDLIIYLEEDDEHD